MSDSTTTFVIIGFVVALFVSNRVPVGIVALGTSIALWATGVLELEQATAGFGDPAVLFIASLFVVSEALDSTGVTAWVGQQLIDRAGTSRTRIVAYVMIACAVLTALVTPNASVAALVPVVVIIAVRVGQDTSQLLMPLAFAAHAGALLALTGSPVSVLVSQSAEEAGLGRFGFFEFALTGVPLLVGTILIVIVGGRRLLPHRSPSSLPPDLTNLESELQQQYFIDGERSSQLFGRSYGAAELVVPPRSPAIGERMGPGMKTHGGALSVVAVLRDEVPVGEVNLAAGDVLLVRGSWRALSREVDADDEVVVVNPPDLIRRQTVPLGAGARESLVVLAVMVLALATNTLPPAIAGVGAAWRARVAPRRASRAGLPVDRVDHSGARGWHAAALDSDADLRCRGPARRAIGRHRRRLRPISAAHRPVRTDRHPRTIDQQHGDRAHRHPRGAVGRC